jgi:heptosyltransferase-1
MRILIVKLTSMGDILFNLPVVADLKARFPHAEIDWAADAAFADLPRAIADISNVYAFPFRANRPRPSLAGIGAIIREIARLRRTSYDLVIDTQGMVKSGLIAWLARTKTRDAKCGYQRIDLAEKMFAWVYKRQIICAREGHAIERYRQEVAQITGQEPHGAPKFRYKDELSHQSSRDSISLPTLFLVPFASQEKKDIPAKTIHRLIEQALKTGYQVVLPSGSAREIALAKEIVERFSASGSVTLLPKMSIAQLIQFMGRVSCVIGADTGLVHIAASHALPVAAIFRVTDAQSLGPHQWAIKAKSLQVNSPDLFGAIGVLLADSKGFTGVQQSPGQRSGHETIAS